MFLESTVIVAKDVQLQKGLPFIDVTVLGMVTVVSDEHASNALSAIDTKTGKFIEANFEHVENADVPIVVTPGPTIVVNFEQFWKA